jgi:ATP-dependent DNA helicase RecG
MERFRAGEIQVLVATTVIEVGIDVPNATVMLVEHPDRFGLAQLHQLRGRVGRGAEESYCVLLSAGASPPRLRAFARTTDGFKIAELDLAERKMGDLLGERQAGSFEVRHARLPDDTDLLVRARRVALAVVQADPALAQRQHQGLKARALERYPRAVELFRVG